MVVWTGGQTAPSQLNARGDGGTFGDSTVRSYGMPIFLAERPVLSDEPLPSSFDVPDQAPVLLAEVLT